MAIYKLAVGESRNIAVSSRFLSIVELNGQMRVSSPAFGVKPFTVKSGYQADMNGITSAVIENIDTVAIEANIEDAGVKITAQGGGAVSVTNKVVVDRIEQPQEFTANVEFNGGNVGLISSSMLNSLDDVSVGVGQSKVLASAGERESLLIQNRGNEHVRIGANTVGATRGFVLEAGSAISFSTKAAVFCYNGGDEAVTITLTEI